MPTPIQEQHEKLKIEAEGSILFFQLGDFYEFFNEDAHICSRILGLNLTARHKGTENEMAMCGFPISAAQNYIKKLLSLNHKLAIVDQYEENGKIYRKISRILTPGSNIENAEENPEENNFIACIGEKKQKYTISFADLSTGTFKTAVFVNENLFFDELYKINPKEILLPIDLYADKIFCEKLSTNCLTPRTKKKESIYKNFLENVFGVLDFAVFEINDLTLFFETSGMLLEFLQETQRDTCSQFKKIEKYDPNDFMKIDIKTFQNLEIFESLYTKNKKISLLGVFSQTKTSVGARKIRNIFLQPLTKILPIETRQKIVDLLVQNPETLEALESCLKQIFDIERIFSKISIRNGNARDILFLAKSFSIFPEIVDIIKKYIPIESPEVMVEYLEGFEALSERINTVFVPEPPLEIVNGGMVRSGIFPELDRLRNLQKDSEKWLEAFIEERKKESGIEKIKIKYSSAFGFTFEVSKSFVSKAPESWIRKQTLVNAQRFTTPELLAQEAKILESEQKSFEKEYEIYLELRKEVLEIGDKIFPASEVIAFLDVFSCFARTALIQNWVRPKTLEGEDLRPIKIDIKDGRHPVVESTLKSPFISNNLLMDDDHRFWLITGPNMAGKSTFLRQNALIIFLAQIGSFVPAGKVQLPLFDRIFTRIGAGDNLSEGKSTFFVEMSETAKILHHATNKSFVILDEIGRGTSTFDGLSLAWSIMEHLHSVIKCKTLFATHYHELIDCANTLSGAENYHISVQESKTDGIRFLRKILPGGMSDSFGIAVAKLAGIPKDVLVRSYEILKDLESNNATQLQMSLFASKKEDKKVVKQAEENEKATVLQNEVDSISLENTTPIEAFDILKKLKKL